MKTKKELNEIKEEVEKLDKKLHELTEEELEQVTGGVGGGSYINSNLVLTKGPGVGNLVFADGVVIASRADIVGEYQICR